MRSLVVLVALLPSVARAALPRFEQRLATIEAVQVHAKAYPHHLRQCSGPGGEEETDVLAFPAGRADRLYSLAHGTGRGDQLRNGPARLASCARSVNGPASAWTYASDVERAMTLPLRTFAAPLPREGALDDYLSFAGTRATRKIRAAGRTTGERTHDTGDLRTAFHPGGRLPLNHVRR